MLTINQKLLNIKFSLVEITPLMAKDWLENNTQRNRSLRLKLVEKYKQDIQLGRWKINHQAIAFDEKENLLDGQHRLHAVIRANKSILSFISTGWPTEDKETAQRTTDIGAKRSPVDIAKLEKRFTDFAITNNHIATVRIFIFAPKMYPNYVSNEDLFLNLDKYKYEIGTAIKIARTGHANTGCGGYVALLARSLLHVDKESIQRFHSIVADPAMSSGPKDSAAVRLGYLMNNTQHSTQPLRLVLYRKAQNALRYFLNREPIKMLVEIYEDLFPIPQEGKAGDE